MIKNKLTLLVLDAKLSICQFEAKSPVPRWANSHQGHFLSITRTSDELSIVSDKKIVPRNVKSVGDWCAFKVVGPLDFALVGILSSLLTPLAKAKISVFTISTYDTDYILVKEHDLQKAIGVLKNKCIVKTII